MEKKETAAKLQLLVNYHEEILKNIRNKKVRKQDIKKADVKKQIIEQKRQTLNHTINNLANEEITDLFEEYEKAGKLDEFIDLNNIEKEIDDRKLLKYQKMEEKKKQREKSNLHNFVSNLTEKDWVKDFKKEKRIVIVLDNAKIHRATLT
ncbi:MAG: hypothetical protein LBU40_01605, partial [Methanobrevibacter sp.]|nr:hypothetical protein [Methanobrevibacter sp.]